jgi:hypothetical protein
MDNYLYSGAKILRARDRALADDLQKKLEDYSNKHKKLIGIDPIENKESLVEQMIDSIRRIKFVTTIRQRRISNLRTDSSSEFFDPIRAAIVHATNGDNEEACWLIFLAIHFGKSSTCGWNFVRDIYNALGTGYTWNWKRISFNPDAFTDWLGANYQKFNNSNYRFGNHRKYESINPAKRNSTGLVAKSYVNWVLDSGSHKDLFLNALNNSNNDSRLAFRYLYKSMNVLRFGRTAKFDYLTMLAKIGLVKIEADSAYMGAATGPVDGARLLFTGVSTTDISRSELDKWLIDLDSHLKVGMQVLEDSLCNWQKSPSKFKAFRG